MFVKKNIFIRQSLRGRLWYSVVHLFVRLSVRDCRPNHKLQDLALLAFDQHDERKMPIKVVLSEVGKCCRQNTK